MKIARMLPVALVSVALTACGSSSSSAANKNGVASLGGVTTTTAGGKVTVAQYQAGMLKYAACMRKNGVNFPDPQFGADGRVTFGGGGGGGGGAGGGATTGTGTAGQGFRNNPNFDKARTACNSIRQGVQSFAAPTAAQRAEQQKALLAFAKCMRSKGVDFPDPQFDANGRPQFGSGTGRDVFNKLRGDPKAQAATQTCRQQAGGALTGGRGGGFGFGGGGRRGGGGGN